MRKVHLLTTVAASLLLAAAASAAENNRQTGKSEMSNPAPAAQQNAPAEKIAPSMNAGQKKPETTGQSPKASDADKAQMNESKGGASGKENTGTIGAPDH